MSDAAGAAPAGTPPPAAAPPAAPADWKASLPDDIRGEPSIATFQDVPSLVKSYVATKALTGRKAYDLPTPEWKPEQWASWNKSIGVPESPDKYSPVDKAVLEKAGLPTEVMAAANAKFHEAGLTDRQVRIITDWYAGGTIKGREMQETQGAAQKEQNVSALKQKFGDKFEAKMGLVKAWIAQNASQGFAEAVDKAGLGNDPEFVQAIIKSAEKTIEDSSRSGARNPFNADSNKAAAVAEIEEMKARRIADRKYNDLFNEPKSAERKRWDDLHALAFTTKAA